MGVGYCNSCGGFDGREVNQLFAIIDG